MVETTGPFSRTELCVCVFAPAGDGATAAGCYRCSDQSVRFWLGCMGMGWQAAHGTNTKVRQGQPSPVQHENGPSQIHT